MVSGRGRSRHCRGDATGRTGHGSGHSRGTGAAASSGSRTATDELNVLGSGGSATGKRKDHESKKTNESKQNTIRHLIHLTIGDNRLFRIDLNRATRSPRFGQPLVEPSPLYTGPHKKFRTVHTKRWRQGSQGCELFPLSQEGGKETQILNTRVAHPHDWRRTKPLKIAEPRSIDSREKADADTERDR